MPELHQVVNFQRLLGQISVAANRAVAAMWHHSPDPVADYPAIVSPFLGASARLSTHWYHSLAPAEPFAATPGPLPDPDVLMKNADYAMKTADPVGTLRGTTDRHVYQTSGATIAHNADREHVRYARYASATACAFCQVLATRKTLYTSEAAATRVGGGGGRTRGTRAIGDTYHDNCHCIAVPVRPGDSYTPPDYTAQWQADYEAAWRDKDTHTMDEIVNHMRRSQYARDHAPKPGPKTAGPAREPGLKTAG